MSKFGKIFYGIKKKGIKGSLYSLFIRYRKPILIEYLRWFYKKHNGIPSDKEFLKNLNLVFLKNIGKNTESVEDIVKYLSEERNNRFLIDENEIAGIKQILIKEFPKEVEEVIKRADGICRHQFKWICPNSPEFGEKINWHSNFEDDRNWPLDFYMDLDYSSEKRIGDVRQTWELNRHQYFVTLGKAYIITGNEKYAKEFVDELRDWIEKNPIPFGINWLHSQETALRMQSWIWAFYIFRNSQHFNLELKTLFFKSLYKHAEYTYWHLSRHLVTHNHLISEICGLIIFYSVFPEFKSAEKKFNELIKILKQELIKQIWENGPSGELSTNYHLFVLDSFLITKIVLEKIGISLSDECDKRIEKMIEYAMFMVRPDGSIPKIGDNDSGRAFRLVDYNTNDRRSYLSTGAVLFNRPDFKYVSQKLSVETLMLLGEKGYDIYKAIIPEAPEKKSVFYKEAGIGFFRNGWNEKSDYLAFRGGPTVLRNNVSVSHNHADYLSFEYLTNGKTIFNDPSTYLYGKDDKWRYYFRKTRAHNTIEIDESDSLNVTSTRFGIPKLYKSKLYEFRSEAEFDYIDMSHSGYQKIGITHRRKLLYYRTKFILITDIINGSGKHKINPFFNLDNNKVLSEDSNILISADNKTKLKLIPIAEFEIKNRILSGIENPVDGWSSTQYGEVHPANVVNYYTENEIPLALCFLIIPGKIDFEMLNQSINPTEQNVQFRLGLDIFKMHLAEKSIINRISAGI